MTRLVEDRALLDGFRRGDRDDARQRGGGRESARRNAVIVANQAIDEGLSPLA